MPWKVHLLCMNLIILAGTTFYIKHTHENLFAVEYTSASIAFATSIGMLAFQEAKDITQYR